MGSRAPYDGLMDEQFATVGNIELCFERFGDTDGEPLLLVMGLGTQMVGWNPDFIAELVRRGFHVVRFDNRDIGRSTHVTDRRPPTTLQLLRRDKRAAAYRLEDMAGDAAGLIEHLGWDSAHVVGASMGGMIAQCVASHHPDRVRSLTSIMSMTGGRWSGQPALSVYPVLLKQAPRDREGYIEHIVRLYATIGSPDFPRDEDELRAYAALAWDRDPHHDGRGAGRQLAAIMGSGDRTADVRRITAPTLVVHGLKDKLVRPSGGRATAKAITNSRLVEIPGMGHDLPRQLWPRIADAIAENAGRAEAARRRVAA